jgi:hypothetical protein
MHKRFLAALALAVTLPAAALAQAGHEHHGAAAAKPKAEAAHHAMSSGWKELDDFHTVMAATWHPVSKSSDFTAIRAKAGDLATAAEKWAAATVPSACDKKENRDAIADVAKQSKALAALVAAKGSDADVKKALHDLHERFEVVEHGCSAAGKHH